MSLVTLSRAYTQMRYALAKSESELEELRMHLHQWARGCPEAKATARSFLLAVVRERQALLNALSEERQRDH